MEKQIAFNVLRKVMIDQQYANIALKQINHLNIALITQLVYGTIQNYQFCFYQWQHLMKSKPKKEIEILINLAVYQKIFVDKLPDYAIVDEANKIAERLFDGRYKRFVNAILRQTFEQEQRVPPFPDSLDAISINYSFPKWLLAMWQKQYGYNAMRQFIEVSHQPPRLYVKINTLKESIDLKELQLLETDVLGCYLADRSLLKSEAFLNGHVLIQDKNAQQVSLFTPIKPHERVLDACAAPGGKSISMAIKALNQGEIIAVDIHQHRVELIEQLIERTGASMVKPKMADATKLQLEYGLESFDGVLVDAPCSGLGVLRRKPDIKQFIKPDDLDQIIALQQDILANVALLVKVGGWLVYATCTMNTKENEKQTVWFLDNFTQFEKQQEHFLDPSITDADGFYMVKFVRIS
jgi:16S rRNA (cytosine967-C5)-methyltransferase